MSENSNDRAVLSCLRKILRSIQYGLDVSSRVSRNYGASNSLRNFYSGVILKAAYSPGAEFPDRFNAIGAGITIESRLCEIETTGLCTLPEAGFSCA